MSKYLSRALGSAAEPNTAQGSPASGRSDSSSLLEQSSGEQASQQAVILHPTRGRSSRFMDKLISRFRSPSPLSPGVGHSMATPVSQSLAVSAGVLAQPHGSYSETSIFQVHGPSPCDLPVLTAGGNVTAVPSGDHGFPSSSGSQSKPITSSKPAPLSTSAPHTPTSTSQVQTPATVNLHAAVLPETKSTPVPEIIEPSSPSAMIWTKALDLIKKKLRDNNLPPLDLMNLTSQSMEENIEAVVIALNSFQKDNKKQQWSYTWRGKEVIVVEHLGKFLKIAEKYSKVVDTAIASSAPVGTLVWAGVRAIMQVRISTILSTY